MAGSGRRVPCTIGYEGKEGGREVVSDEPLYETDFSLGRSLDEFVK